MFRTNLKVKAYYLKAKAALSLALCLCLVGHSMASSAAGNPDDALSAFQQDTKIQNPNRIYLSSASQISSGGCSLAFLTSSSQTLTNLTAIQDDARKLTAGPCAKAIGMQAEQAVSAIKSSRDTICQQSAATGDLLQSESTKIQKTIDQNSAIQIAPTCTDSTAASSYKLILDKINASLNSFQNTLASGQPKLSAGNLSLDQNSTAANPNANASSVGIVAQPNPAYWNRPKPSPLLLPASRESDPNKKWLIIGGILGGTLLAVLLAKNANKSNSDSANSSEPSNSSSSPGYNGAPGPDGNSTAPSTSGAPNNTNAGTTAPVNNEPFAPPSGDPSKSACAAGGKGKNITVAQSGGDFATIQEALNAAKPGDTVLVKPGKYRSGISFPQSGTSGACITLKGEPGAMISGSSPGIFIKDKNYIAIIGFTITNITKGEEDPTGIFLSGSTSHIDIRNNLIERIESSDQAHGINIVGKSSTPSTDILIDGNEIRNCKLGHSESLTVNGNVTKFTISRNKIHDNNNIGIDISGFYNVGPAGQDQARNGAIVDNTVYNITAKGNPRYSDPSAGGIYVDGGKNINIERNKVANCDIGIEVASEKSGKKAEAVSVQNNNISNSHHGNILLGGASSASGGAANIIITNNTLSNSGRSEIVLQHNVNGASIKNNIIASGAKDKYLSTWGSNNTNILVENNGPTPTNGTRSPASADPKEGFFQLKDK